MFSRIILRPLLFDRISALEYFLLLTDTHTHFGNDVQVLYNLPWKLTFKTLKK